MYICKYTTPHKMLQAFQNAMDTGKKYLDTTTSCVCSLSCVQLFATL